MKNLVASILARLRNVSREHGVVYNELLIRYAIERVLKRIELSPYASKCILKGGALFIVWSEKFSYRPTMDADLEFRGDGSPENLKKVFVEVAGMPGEEDDGLRIDAKSIAAKPIRNDDQYGGVRVTMMAYLGTVRIPLQFDVGVGDAITPAPRQTSFPVLLDGSVPRLKVYPRETVIAEKYETIVKLGYANSRMKDYYDLWIMSRDPQVVGEVVRTAIQKTFSRRHTAMPEGTPVGLSEEFANDPSKLTQWNAFIRKNRLSVGDVAFPDVVRVIRAFLVET